MAKRKATVRLERHRYAPELNKLALVDMKTGEVLGEKATPQCVTIGEAEEYLKERGETL